METEKKDEEFDINDAAITFVVDSDLIDRVRKGDITRLILEIDEQNQSMILETVDGNPVLLVEDTPTSFHSCYIYNEGEFPYAINRKLGFIVLSDGKDYSPTRIIGVDTEPGTRFFYKGAGEPFVEDPNGDSCVWNVYFEVVPILKEPKTYLIRWNPSISSFKEKDYEECVENMLHGMFRINWSIFEWEEARRGDIFYMMRVGDDKAGIVFNGQFIYDPYPADDWAGSNKRRMYVDMVGTNPSEPGEMPHISLEELQKAIPEFEWAKGHSGVLLPNEVADKLDAMWEKV